MQARKLFYLFITLFISLVVYQIIRQLYAPHWEEISNSAYGVLIGKPDWFAYQNRLLGPYLIYLISLAGFSYISSAKFFVFITIVIQTIVLFVLLVKKNLPYQQIIVYILAYSFIFLAFQEYSLYSWDSIDAILFIFFAWGIFENKSIFYFVAIFLVSLFNRESALFISIYLIIDAFEIKSLNIGLIALKSKAKFVAGVVLTTAGIIFIKIARETLFISLSNGFLDDIHRGLGNHINLTRNLIDLFFENFTSIHIINSLFIFVSVSFLFYFMKQYKEEQLKALIVFLLIMVNILIFGLVNESRLFVVLIPFLIFFHHSIQKQDSKP